MSLEKLIETLPLQQYIKFLKTPIYIGETLWRFVAQCLSIVDKYYIIMVVWFANCHKLGETLCDKCLTQCLVRVKSI